MLLQMKNSSFGGGFGAPCFLASPPHHHHPLEESLSHDRGAEIRDNGVLFSV